MYILYVYLLYMSQLAFLMFYFLPASISIFFLNVINSFPSTNFFLLNLMDQTNIG